MTSPLDGCWQVVFENTRDAIVGYDQMYTTVSMRPTGLSVYVDGWFVEIRAEAGRRPPAGWPPSQDERAAWFRSALAHGGTVRWTTAEDGFFGEHAIEMSGDPREAGAPVMITAQVDGEIATARVTREGKPPRRETWRRLSGRGSSPLAGAWQSTGEDGRWLWLVTAGHYGIVHEVAGRPDIPHNSALTDADVAALVPGFGANAGAILVSEQSFDNWPFVAANAGAYEARKHPTFWLHEVSADTVVLGMQMDGSDASTWTRLPGPRAQPTLD